MEDHAKHPPPAQEGQERGQVQNRTEERRARPHVIQRLAVERRESEEERGCGRWKAGYPVGATIGGWPPEMVTDKDKYESRRDEVENQVKEMVAPRLVAGDGVVQREGNDEDRANIHVLPHRREGEGIGEKQRNVPEAADRRVARDSVAVIEIKTDTETICVGNGESDAEQGEEQERKPVAGGNSKSHGQMLAKFFYYEQRLVMDRVLEDDPHFGQRLSVAAPDPNLSSREKINTPTVQPHAGNLSAGISPNPAHVVDRWGSACRL